MFSEFCVTSVFTDLSLKRIVIETNFTVQESTVNIKSVQLVSSVSGLLENYKLQIEDKNIVLILNEWPQSDVSYMLKVYGIQDILGRSLNSPISKEIVFVSDIKSKVQIMKPVHNETLTINPIGIEINAISEDEQGLKYHYEISSDMAFFNIVQTIISVDMQTQVSLDDGQYYLRVRAENESYRGDWCEVITFLVATKVTYDNNENNDFLDDILLSSEFFIDPKDEPQIIDRLRNGTTDPEFYITLNKEMLFPQSLTITAYRRDF